jgi:hypothetical protein
MGMYTHWSIECKVHAEYLELVRHFIEHNVWPDDVPDFITKWKHYLKSVGSDEYYIGLDGYDGHWGYRRELKDDVLYLCGSSKNYHSELQVFLCKVLVRLGVVVQCKIITDYYLDYVPEYSFDSDTEEDQDEGATFFSDYELRSTTWKKLSF